MYYKNKYMIIMIIILTMLFQVVGPVVNYVYADVLDFIAEGFGDGETVTESVYEIPNTLTSFSLVVNGVDLVTATEPEIKALELEQNQEADFTLSFNVNLDNDKYEYKAGDYFEFDFPTAVKNFGGFNGTARTEADDAVFKYMAISEDTPEVVRKIRVYLEEDVTLDQISDSINVTLNFKSEFELSGDSTEQEVIIPDGSNDGGTKSISLKFKPTSKDEKMTKKSLGFDIADGERYINWEIWVNTAGKDLEGATIVDVPDITGTNPAHEIVMGSVNMAEYDIGLNGVVDKGGLGTSKTTNGNFSDINMNGKKAYKITYKTKVTKESPSGEQIFKNKATLISPGFITEISNGNQSITYGEALHKFKDTTLTNNNYESNWEIRYNYNLASITEPGLGEYNIVDTFPGVHNIDTGTIKVYKMDVDVNGNVVDGTGTEIGTGLTGGGGINGPSYNITTITDADLDPDVDGFNLKFNDTVTDAYRITYKAKYDSDDFYTGDSTTLTNTVIGAGKALYPAHGIGQGILAKSHSLNLATQELTWTIKIKADNKAITDLTLTDVFAQKGAEGMGNQTLQGNVTVTGTINQEPTTTLDPDQTKGFTITGINISKGNTATITYTTKYDIITDGKVAKEYKNTATANWDTKYTVIVSDSYKPGTTTANNGSKSGKYNYITQEFTWGAKINFNKQNIKEAILTDNLGPGHEIVDDSFIIYDFAPIGGDDTSGTKGITKSLEKGDDYTVAVAADKKSFTLTFSNNLDINKNNKAYYVEYKTKDSDNIIGLSVDEQLGQVADDKGKYTNTATFKTSTSTTHTLESEAISVTNANHLISKSVTSNKDKETLSWVIDINKSLSDIGEVILTDIPSANLMLIPGTIEVRKMTSVNPNTGALVYGPWDGPNPRATIDNANGGFTLNLGDLSKKTIQVRYETLVLGKQGDPYYNNATITYNGSGKDDNGEEGSGVTDKKFQFSSSDANSSSSRGDVKFQKVGKDLATGNEIILQGVDFKLIKKIGINEYTIREATSDTDGNIEFNNIGYGKYFIREVLAPEGYLKMGDQEFLMSITTDIKLSGNEDKVVEITNIKRNQGFKLTKVDADDATNNLSGSVFELYKSDGTLVTEDSNGNDITGKLTTDSNGTILIDDIPVGNYYLKETKAPDGYWLDENLKVEFIVGLDNATIIELTVENTKQGDLIIKKIDKDDNTPLSGAVFTLYDASNNIIGTATSGVDGIAKFINIKYGPYKLNETKAPDGYVGTDDIDIIIDSPITGELEVKNEKIHQGIKLVKVDSTDGNIVLEGAVFTLHNGITHEQVLKIEKGEDIGEIKTNTNGEVTVNNLAPGTYYFKEITAPNYYLLPSDIKTNSFTIVKDQTTIEKVIKENTRGKGSVKITKVDLADNNTLLNGVEFELSNNAGFSITKSTVDGIITFTDLLYDIYILKEIKAHDDYVPNTNPIEIEVNGATDGIEIEVVVENTKKDYSVKLTKYNSNMSLKLKGAIFELRKKGIDDDYEVVAGIDVSKLTTDDNGEIYLEGLAVGVYQLVEVTAPSGYVLDKTSVAFEIKENQTITTLAEKINHIYYPPTGPYYPPIDPTKPVDPPTNPTKPVDPPTDPTDPVDPDPVDPPTDPETSVRPPTTNEENTPKDTPKEGEVKVPEGGIPKVNTPPKNGTVTVDKNGKWTYTPNPGYEGKDKFSIIITHPDGSEEEIFFDIDVETPLGVVEIETLPKTGQVNSILFYFAGLFFIIVGIFFRKRTV